MTVSTTCQLMIFRTKKRLYNQFFLYPLAIIAIMGVCIIASFCYRAVSLPGSYGIVRSELPLINAPLNPSSPLLNMPGDTLSENTPLIIITNKEFFFGTLTSFTDNLIKVRDKFRILHEVTEQGIAAPRVDKLVSTMNKWDYQRRTRSKLDNQNIAVLLPTDEIPLAVVTQVIAGLNDAKLYDRVILASELL